MGDVVSRPEFRFWEINDAHPRFDYELNLFDEQPELSMSHNLILMIIDF